MPDFKRLYLDTTVLRKSNWPHISAELAFLLELARNFSVEVFLTEVSEREREAQWLRDVTAASQKLDAAADKLAVNFSAVGAERIAIPGRDFAALQAAYRSQSDAAKARGGIRTIPITTRPLTEALQLAIDRTPPFQMAGTDKVTGFQDALILLSTIDDAKAAGETIVALFSDDEIFSRIGHVTKAEGVSVRHFRAIDDVWKLLAGEMEPHFLEWWKRQRTEIQRALESHTEQMIQLLREKITPEVVNYRVERIEAVGKPEILEVDVPLPPFPREPGPYQTAENAEFRISVRIGVEVRALARPGLSGMLAAEFFQQMMSEARGKTESQAATNEELKPETSWKKVRLEANAVYSGGQYGINGLEFVRVES